MFEKPRDVAILVFPDVEVLDFCGPFEVFSLAGIPRQRKLFNVFIVAQENAPLSARNNLNIIPHYSFNNCPESDILIVPGGPGTRKEMHNALMLHWIKDYYEQLELLLSVCTGSLLLGKAGLLNNLTVTTHHLSLDLLIEVAPQATVIGGERWVDNGKIITAAGVSAGIDMSLYVVEKLFSRELAIETASFMEYRWQR